MFWKPKCAIQHPRNVSSNFTIQGFEILLQAKLRKYSGEQILISRALTCYFDLNFALKDLENVLEADINYPKP